MNGHHQLAFMSSSITFAVTAKQHVEATNARDTGREDKGVLREHAAPLKKRQVKACPQDGPGQQELKQRENDGVQGLQGLIIAKRPSILGDMSRSGGQPEIPQAQKSPRVPQGAPSQPHGRPEVVYGRNQVFDYHTHDTLDTSALTSSSWIPDEIGYFDPNPRPRHHIYAENNILFFSNVYAFTDHIRGKAMFKPEPLIRANIHVCLRGKALLWYNTELDEAERYELRSLPIDEGWIKKLIARFQMFKQTARQLFLAERYTWADFVGGYSQVEWVHDMLRHARAAEYVDTDAMLQQIRKNIDDPLNYWICPPLPGTSVVGFLREVDDGYNTMCHDQMLAGTMP